MASAMSSAACSGGCERFRVRQQANSRATASRARARGFSPSPISSAACANRGAIRNSTISRVGGWCSASRSTHAACCSLRANQERRRDRTAVRPRGARATARIPTSARPRVRGGRAHRARERVAGHGCHPEPIGRLKDRSAGLADREAGGILRLPEKKSIAMSGASLLDISI